MIEPKVGQHWIHKKRGIELVVDKLFHNGVYARWETTSGFLAFASLQKNYRYDRVEAKEVLAPFGWMFQEMYEELIHVLEDMDDVDLITTLIAAEELTADCWWTIWAARDEVLRETRRILTYHRDPYQVLHCSKMTTHLPHIWKRPRPPVFLEGSVDNSTGRYYCRGRRIAEGGHRPPKVRVSLPA